MRSPLNRILQLLTVGLALSLDLYAADGPRQGAADVVPPPQRSIGFRGDGSGVFADAKPPTEFDAVTGKNLRWKVALPNHSNSSPIVVGDKVFVVCAAGWPEGQDCAQLLCFDAATGKELWRRDVDEFAMRPAEEAKAAREVRAEYHRRIRLLNNGLFAYHQTTNDAERAALVKQAEEIGRNGFILAGNHLYGLPNTTVGWARAGTNNADTVNVVRVKPAGGTGRPVEQRTCGHSITSTVSRPNEHTTVACIGDPAVKYDWNPQSRPAHITSALKAKTPSTKDP